MSHHLIGKLIGIAARIAKENYLLSNPDSILNPKRPDYIFNFKRKTKSWEYFDCGNAKLERGNYIAAIRDYDAAIEIDSDRLFYYIHRGIAKKNAGDKVGALRDYEKAMELDKIGVLKNYEKTKELAEFCQIARKDLPVL